MRLRVVTVALLLTLASKGDGRPKDPDPLDGGRHEAVAAILDNSDSRQDRPRDFKDYQSIDHSLRTVATQLLNATAKHDDLVRTSDERVVTVETPMQIVHISTRIEDAAADEKSHDQTDESSRMKFGIPINSKFGHFDITNPGQAMVLTDEEIEREMATATAYTQRIQPTTASMLSTWISLYPPSATTEGNDVSDVKIDVQSNQIPTTDNPNLSSTVAKQSTGSVKPFRKAEMKQTSLATGIPTSPAQSTTKIIKNSNSVATSNDILETTPLIPISMIDDEDKTTITQQKQQTQRITTSSMPTRSPQPTRKPQNKGSTTPKSNRPTSPKTFTTKFPKGNSTVVKTRSPFPRTPTTSKTESVTSTSKIEKVTLRPTLSPFLNRTESADRPQFITKMKASIMTNGQKTPASTSTTPKFGYSNILSKINFTTTEPPRTKVPDSTKINNVLKVHPKQPAEDTRIEVQPIHASPPVPTIDRIGDTSADEKNSNDVLENNSTDVKVDTELVTINTIIPDESSSAEPNTITTTTTTKKPRSSNKRKKNKNRRRRPSSSTTQLSTSPSDEELTYTTIDALDLQSNGIQESKIEPESKAPPAKKKKKKPSANSQVQKPIGTQLYNFISRDVMPSVGVMSLVGLGLGLASYFLYPFGSVIARRNYDVEPNNYKYNLEEYGGNYGLNEEEVLTKLYSGMTENQHRENRYNAGTKNEKNPNYYRYTGSEQSHPKVQLTTKYPSMAAKTNAVRVAYKPVSTTSHAADYRKSDFKYPDVATTSNYYQRQQQQQQPTDFLSTAGKAGIGNNRQFVVGNIPKEYSVDEVDKVPEAPRTESSVDFLKFLNQNEDAQTHDTPHAEPLVATASINPDALISINEKDQHSASFEEMEFSPTAVAVEHGPRSLRIFDNHAKIPSRRKRNVLEGHDERPLFLLDKMRGRRVERSSVIQVIPSKSEIEKERKEEEQEEDLSNEILDIIDEALPGKSDLHKKRHDEKLTTATPAKVSKLDISDKIAIITPVKSFEKTSSTPKTITKAETSPSNSTTSTTSKTTTSSTTLGPTEFDFVDLGETTENPKDNVFTTAKPKPPETIFGFAKRVAQFKLRLGLTILKHASENLAKYIGNVQKRINGDEA